MTPGRVLSAPGFLSGMKTSSPHGVHPPAREAHMLLWAVPGALGSAFCFSCAFVVGGPSRSSPGERDPRVPAVCAPR